MDVISGTKSHGMREKTAFFLAFALTIITSLLGYIYQQRLWEVIDTIFIVNTFVLCIQLYYDLRGGDPVYGAVIQHLRSQPDVTNVLLEFLQSVSATLHCNDKFLRQKAILFLQEAQSICHGLERGILEVDLRPGGLFFRETDIAEFARARLRATSNVNVATYWLGVPGKRLLRKNKMKIESGLKVERIFIEASAWIPTIQDVVADNKAIGVTTRIVNSDEIDKGLIRDFAIMDDGSMAVELILEDRLPIRAVFYVASVGDGKRKIDELEGVWTNLIYHAQAA
jgi:hypothetical protein